MPGQWWTAEQLGLTAVPESEWPERFVRTYLTAAEYFEPILRSFGMPFEANRWICAILQTYSRDDLVCELAALNHAAKSKLLAAQYEEQFLAAWQPPAIDVIRGALNPERGGERPTFLARQGVLRALRAALVPEPNPQTVPATIARFVETLGLTASAILLVHIVAADLYSTRPSSEPSLGGLPESLAMEMIANGLFNEDESPNGLVARTWLLWHEYDAEAVIPKPRLLPKEMIKDAVDVDLDDVLALGFAYYAFATSREFGKPNRLNPYRGHPIDDDIVDKFLSRFASTLDELSTSLAACPQRWQMGPIQDRPLARIGDDIVVLDQQYLIERVTRGLFWLVHDHERSVHGPTARLHWTQTYAKMIELRAEDQLQWFAPHLLGEGSTFFTEEDLNAAFGKKGSIDKASDVGIDFGEATVLAEIVNTQATADTREKAEVAAFKKDTERMVLKKARQLHATALNLLRDPQPEKSPLPTPAKKIYPVIVRGGGFPVNPATRRYIDERLQQELLLSHADARIQQLALVDLEELELIEMACRVQRKSLPEILDGWISSSYRAMALRSHLVVELAVGTAGPPLDIQGALGRALTSIAARLGTTWEPPASGSPSDPEPAANPRDGGINDALPDR